MNLITQISINPLDYSLIESLAIDHKISTNPAKGDRLFIPERVAEELRDKLNSANPYPLWDKIKAVLNDEDTSIFNQRYFLIEEVIHFPDKIIYVIGDGFWARENI